ncbi:MAG: hypothetical protein NZ957_00305 [Thaumarchaeota archaeon]|nr:hypothetical protein [Candidatus Calditenuaceae archaeon]MDW8041219.1 hypothetical protein [Nitrososphaerota archaeon]
MKVDLLIAEAAIELIPPELWREPDVVAYCAKRRKEARWTLLDSSYHHRAMTKLEDERKRGRPDIVHFTLLEALGSPLNLAGLLRVHVHTRDGWWIRVNPSTRLPRVYERFKGLIEHLYRHERLTSEDGTVLLEMERVGLKELLGRLGPGRRVLLHESGSDMDESMVGRLGVAGSLTLVVGGFPHGDFSSHVFEMVDERVRVSDYRLDAWVAVSRALCLFERTALRP